MNFPLSSWLALSALGLFVACDRGPTVDVRGEGASDRADALERVMLDVDRRYPTVEQMPVASLDEKLARRDRIVLLDVREDVEFAVARLAGARRVAPDSDSDQVSALAGPDINGATVVFYCSVGERSSRMAKRASKTLLARGAAAVYNLRGGIFAWHNAERALVDARGKTDLVHPYNDRWGELLVFRERLAKKPRAE